MKIDKFTKLIWSRSSRERLAGGAVILLSVAFWLYNATLAPYLNQFVSLSRELKAQTTLLDTKIKRSRSQSMLESEQEMHENNLRKINLRFFTVSEADGFMRKLPGIVSGFGGQVVVLKPISQPWPLSKKEKIEAYVRRLALPKSNEDKIIDLLGASREQIHSAEGAQEFYKTSLGMLPEAKRKEFHSILMTAGSDPFAEHKVRQIGLDATIQGRYRGILSLFDWLAKYGKLIEVERIQIFVMPDKAPEIEAKLMLRIYSID